LTKTNERSGLLKLESLEEIKKRDVQSKQKELMAQINQKKEQARLKILDCMDPQLDPRRKRA
jgi:hypothetical protein